MIRILYSQFNEKNWRNGKIVIICLVTYFKLIKIVRKTNLISYQYACDLVYACMLMYIVIHQEKKLNAIKSLIIATSFIVIFLYWLLRIKPLEVYA